MRLLALPALLALLALLSSLPSPATAARKKSCRTCTCTMVISSSQPLDAKRYRETLAVAMSTRNGGGGFSYTVQPHLNKYKQWESSISVPRMCGNGGTISRQFPADSGSIKNSVIFDCTCHPSVRCQDESDCGKSGF